MTVIAPEARSAEYLVDREPAGAAECATMVDAACAFGDRFGRGPAIDAAIAGIQQLRRPFRAPEVFLGTHTSHTFTIEGEEKTAHWMVSNNAMGTVPEGVLDDPRAPRQAALLTGAAWAAALTAGYGTPQPRTGYFPGVLDPAWLADLPAPTPAQHDPGQLTALIEGSDFARFAGPEQVRDGYRQQRRTYLFEGINGHYSWAHLVSRWLGALSGCELTVLVDLFDSRHGDGRFGTHYDCWFNISIQLAGRKHWRIGPGLMNPGQEVTAYTMNPGDVLVIPHDLPHDVQTPAEPGHSRHLIFTVDRREPEQAPAP